MHPDRGPPPVDRVHKISYTIIIRYFGLFMNLAKRSLDFWVINLKSMVFVERPLVFEK
jgi:hypothetical protein